MKQLKKKVEKVIYEFIPELVLKDFKVVRLLLKELKQKRFYKDQHKIYLNCIIT